MIRFTKLALLAAPVLFTPLIARPDAPRAAPAAWTTEANGVRVAEGVTYATVGGEALKLDLAVPKGDGPHPVVVCFHGGAWRLGHRSHLSSYIRSLAADGYAAATVSYRFAPKHKFPAQLEDAKTAVRFLRANAKTFALDAENFAALGLSAGAHLAILLGTTDSSHGFDGPLYPDQSSRVRCVVDYFGPTDLSLYAPSEGLVDAYIAPFLGAGCRTDPAAYKKASPLEYVTRDTCPMLVFHGTADLLVPVIHSERLAERCRRAGAACELVVLPGEWHGFSGEGYGETTSKTLPFLDKYLRGKK